MKETVKHKTFHDDSYQYWIDDDADTQFYLLCRSDDGQWSEIDKTEHRGWGFPDVGVTAYLATPCMFVSKRYSDVSDIEEETQQ